MTRERAASDEPASLTARTVRALGARLAGQTTAALLGVGTLVALARLLPPAEFGLYAIAAATVDVAELLGGLGILEALVQRRDLTPGHAAAGASLQLGASVAASLLLMLVAGPAEALVGIPGLAALLRLQALVPPLTALAVVPASHLSRALAFGPLASADVVLRVTASSVAIALALGGAGASALVYGAVAGAAARTTALWIAAPVRPRLRFGAAHVRDLYRFGSGMVLIGAANLLARRLDVLVIGARLGTATVGLYQRAFQLVVLPLGQLLRPATRVLFAAMATVSDDPPRFRRAYLAIVRVSALVGLPALTAVWVTGDLLIAVAYGPAWSEAVPILRLLAISGYFRIAYHVHGLAVQASGRPLAEGVRQIAYLVVIVTGALAASAWGILGVVIAIVLASALFLASMTRLALALTGVCVADWLRAMTTGASLSVAIAAAIVAVRLAGPHMHPVVALALSAAAAGVAYVGGLRWLATREDRALLFRIGSSSGFASRLLRFALGARPPRATRLTVEDAGPVTENL